MQRRIDPIERANRAVKIAHQVEFVLICGLMFLAMFGMGYLASIGPEIRAARMAVPVEQVEQADRVSRWRDHPNTSECGPACVARIGNGEDF